MEAFLHSLTSLRAYVEREQFKGYDPYDALNGRIDFSRLGKWAPILATQFQKRSPVNVRKWLGITKDYNSKAIGLLLQAYATIYELQRDEEALTTADFLFDWLVSNSSNGYSGFCWGYNFDWASPAKYLAAFTPSIVVTGFVTRGISKYYEVTNRQQALDVLRSACDFVLKDVPVIREGDGICFSYTPVMRDCCYNASMLGAELLAGVSALTGDTRLRELATQAVDFVVERQQEDGHWNYSVDLESGEERRQIDFHQGFVLDSLHACITSLDLRDTRYTDALTRGAAFYRRRQFNVNGRSKWRLPRDWPADIHHQAQGILTFGTLNHLDPQYLSFAKQIAKWTIEHMQDKQGFFYYRKGRVLTNRISYMRWGQSWMLLSLASLIATIRTNNENPSLSRASRTLSSL